jgi:hypothetical protein
MSESKPLSEMSFEEIIEELRAIRERRAQAKERAVRERTPGVKTPKVPGVADVSGMSALDDLFSEDEEDESQSGESG